MNDEAFTLPARAIAIALMRSAIALLDHAGKAEAAAALQNAVDIAEEDQATRPT